ncbi:DUF2802 domain-containing protein [Endothiovibrio diazotrophicus]
MTHWLLLLGAAVVMLAFLVVFLMLRLRLREQEDERLRQEVQRLRDDLGALCSGAVGVSERVARIEQKLQRVSERQEQMEFSTVESQPYDQAVELARKGATAEELVAHCGLTKGEADLVVMMHRMDVG